MVDERHLQLRHARAAGQIDQFSAGYSGGRLFDIFGTVVDWHGSIVREMAQLHPAVDGSAFALAWRAGYKPAMARVMRASSAGR